MNARTLALLLLAACRDPEPAAQCDRAAAGTICTIAGSGEMGYDGDATVDALEAAMSLPMDTLTAPDGAVYILDWNNHRVRKVTTDGKLHHVAGRGELGGTLDDPANSDFNHPTGMAFTPNGDRIAVAAWHNSKIREIDLATGDILDTCGDGRRAYFGDGLAALTSSLDLPASVLFNPDGELVIMDQANQVIRKVDQSGIITRVAGRCIVDRPAPSGPGPCAVGREPAACAAPSGKSTCGDPATSCGGPCNPGYGGEGGPALEMRMGQPFGQSADPAGRMAYAPNGDLYFADTSNNLIRRIDGGGNVHRVAGQPPVEGAPRSGSTGDGGPALDALLNNPVDLAFNAAGELYFTDVYNHCVRVIGADGTIRTAVGTCGTGGDTGDGGPAPAALLKRPYGIEIAPDGALLVTDTGNNRIRRVHQP